MLRGERWAALLLVTVVAVAGVGAAAGARPATTSAKSSLTVSDPCSYLSPSQVRKAFGGAVRVVRPVATNSVVPTVCKFDVGAAGSLGTLVSSLLYPFFPPPGQTGIDVVESQRANDTVTGLTLERVNVGKQAYADLDLSIVVVAASKKFAFSLQWLPPGVSTEGSTLTPKVEKTLLALAKSVVARAPR